MKKKMMFSILMCILLGALLILGIRLSTVFGVSGGTKATAREDYHTELFGENVYIFSPEDDPTEVQQILDDLYDKQEANQFGEERYAVYFLPGTYDESISVHVGFDMQVAGLGLLPTDTQIETLDCLARWLGDDSNHNACCNFWRSVENLSLGSNTTWAVSQATDMRRVYVDGALFLHDDYGWCSGGFLADSAISTMVDSGSQQQWLSRNCDWQVWMDDNWNMVFVGLSEGSAPEGTWPAKQYTEVETTDLVREKPFLIYDEKKGYGVYVPAVRENSTGTTWQEGVNPVWLEEDEMPSKDCDCILPIDRFYVAKPEDSAATINEALASGKQLLLTPGVYELDAPIEVTDSTIVLGMGLATLRNTTSNACMEVEDCSGTVIAGILFDAGTAEGTADLLQIKGDGEETKDCPISLSDLYFRVGGGVTESPCTVDTCVIIDADDVICDNFWVWRADHGDQVAWDKNVANTGIEINGDRVIAYALMVEHFEKYQTIWNGNEGRLYMYQCEIPYDVPDEESWTSHDGSVHGYASIKVAEDVTDFEGYGIGIYLYNRDAAVRLHTAVELPDAEGVSITHICTVMITGNPGMEHIINESGNAVMTAGAREIIRYYENGSYE